MKTLKNAVNVKMKLGLSLRKLRTVLIHSKHKWFKNGEKPSKFLLNLEMLNTVNGLIEKVI